MGKSYKVKFKCNINHEHKAPLNELIEEDTITFCDQSKAVEFLMECTVPITKLVELGCNYIAVKKIGNKKVAL